MKRLFIDSSALIALAKINDNNHQRAKACFEELVRSSPFCLITSDYILDETTTRLRDAFGAAKASFFCKKIFESPLYKIYFVDKAVFKAALEKMEKYADKPLSLTDCTSFILMEKLRLTTAFTFDDDFRKVGFEMIPIEGSF